MKYRIQAVAAGHKSAEQVPEEQPNEEVEPIEADTEVKDEE